MTYLGGRFVGPSLGSASIHAGVVASLAGLALIAGFMLLYYNRAGINALVSVVVNLLLLLGLMAYSEAALTLPGIAGLILTIGMGVDSNVLIFERIKEELAAGRGAKAAVAAGFDRVFLTILDTHVASLIAAAFLFQFGTGADPRLRHDADVRPARQRVHGRLRVPHDLRGRPRARARDTLAHGDLHAALPDADMWTSTGGAGTR